MVSSKAMRGARSADDDDNSLMMSDESCPNCKKTRYMNPNIKFLISRVCYHKMCSGCRDRIFSAGPANCPIAGCKYTLRYAQFTPQRFEDVQIEREVDIRKRVSEVFNRREEEFEDLHSWNDYLEMVEGLTYDLIFGDTKSQASAQKKLNSYKEANVASIKQNATMEKDEVAVLEAKERQEKEMARAGRLAARKQYEEEAKAKAESEQRIIEQLASGQGDADRIVKKEEQVAKKNAAKRSAFSSIGPNRDAAMNGNDAFVIRGLKKREAPAKELPYEPFGGLELKNSYFTLQEVYAWDWLNKARNDVKISAGGYDTTSYGHRALCDAFSGLGVFVGEDENAAMQFDTLAANHTAINASPEVEDSKEDDDVF